MNKKHLLLLTPGFPENEADTRCIPALQLFVEELNRREEFHLSIISFHYPYQAKDYFWKNIEVHALGGDNKKGIRAAVLFAQVIRTAKKIHKKNPVDQVHSFWLGQCAWIGNKLSAKWKVKHSCTLMGQDVFKNNAYLSKVKPLPTLIALSKYQAQTLEQEWNIKVEQIIPWGTAAIEPSISKRSITVLGVGNLTELKSFDRFIEIISLVKKDLPNVKAAIIGEGNQKSFKALLQKHGLESNISFLGIKDREEVLTYMQNSKAFLHCSNFESFGMVLIEALACGAAVFSTPVGIAPEIKEVNLFDTNEHAAEQLVSFLQTDSENIPLLPYDIKTTVNSYLNSVF